MSGNMNNFLYADIIPYIAGKFKQFFTLVSTFFPGVYFNLSISFNMQFLSSSDYINNGNITLKI